MQRFHDSGGTGVAPIHPAPEPGLTLGAWTDSLVWSVTPKSSRSRQSVDFLILYFGRWLCARKGVDGRAMPMGDERLGVGACADWCLGARVEAAWLGGMALADRALATLARLATNTDLDQP